MSGDSSNSSFAAAIAQVVPGGSSAPAPAPAPAPAAAPAVEPAAPAAPAPAAAPVAAAPVTPSVPAQPAPSELALATGPTEDLSDLLGDVASDPSFEQIKSHPVFQKVKDEAARRRIENRELRQTWEGLQQTEAEYWQMVVAEYKQDPVKAVQQLLLDGQAFLERQGVQPVAPPPVPQVQQFQQHGQPAPQAQVPPQRPGALDPNAPLTIGQFQALQAEQARAAAAAAAAAAAEAEQAARVEQVRATARELGYEPGSPRYNYLLDTARRLPDGDIRRAHQIITDEIASQANRQAQELVTGKVQQAQTIPAPVAGVVQGSSGPAAPTSFKEAAARAQARMQQRPPV